MQAPKERSIKAIAVEFFDGFMRHDLMTLAAALAFYTALSLAPILLLILSVLALMGPGSEAKFLSEVSSLVGADAAKAVQAVVQSASSRPSVGSFAGLVSLATLLFSASGVFAQLQSSINLIWDARAESAGSSWVSYLRKRIFSMGMVLALAFIALVSLIVSTTLTAILPAHGFAWQLFNNSVSVLVFACLFGTLFKYLPDVPISWRHVLTGGLFTSVLFTGGKSLIGLYLGESAIGSAYGAAGSLIVLLAWVYYSSIIVFMGAEFTRAVYSAEITDEAVKGTSEGRLKITTPSPTGAD